MSTPNWPHLANLVQEEIRDHLGESVTYTSPGYPAKEIVGVFESMHENVELRDGVPVHTTRPILTVRDADLDATPKVADRCTARGVYYSVVEVMPDGEGGTVLHLHRC